MYTKDDSDVNPKKSYKKNKQSFRYDSKYRTRKLHTSCINNNEFKNLIDFTPIKTEGKVTPKSIVIMDIETMDYKKVQIPTLITCSYTENGKTKSFYSILNINLLENTYNEEIALQDLWYRFFELFFKHITFNCIIFTHNLGKFDGLFIYKALILFANAKETDTIIDKHNSFIQISTKYYDCKLIWKDSLRIFPVSLEDLCKTFNVKGKLQKYDKEFNDLSIFNNPRKLSVFIKYGLQDSVALLEALSSAQKIYIKDYNVDIATIWSTSTLSLKIFRQMFLDITIPSLSGFVDTFVRKSYFGRSNWSL